jgi:Zn-finger nucleic acid-binding protein
MREERVKLVGPDVIIDVCPDCGGIWFDNDELRKVLGDKGLADYLTKHIGTQSNSELVCPRCGGLMDLEHAQDVEIDVCLRCHGAWLDSGEMGKLKEKSEAGYKGEQKDVEMGEELIAKQREKQLNRLFRRIRR